MSFYDKMIQKWCEIDYRLDNFWPRLSTARSLPAWPPTAVLSAPVHDIIYESDKTGCLNVCLPVDVPNRNYRTWYKSENMVSFICVAVLYSCHVNVWLNKDFLSSFCSFIALGFEFSKNRNAKYSCFSRSKLKYDLFTAYFDHDICGWIFVGSNKQAH